jgi:peptidyl-prolyl cis-trans isomerase D
MIIGMRTFVGTWPAKVLFALLILAFAVWGIEDVIRNLGRDTTVARVAGEGIEAAEIQAATTREVQQFQQRLGGRVSVEGPLREAIAAGVLEREVMRRIIAMEAARLGTAAPAGLLRDELLAIPGLRAADGRVDRQGLLQLMRANDTTEQGLLALVAEDLRRRQLLGSLRAGASAPDLMTRPIYAFETERRVLDLVALPLAAAPAPAEPSADQLRRFHENNPGRFSSPETREAVIALLTPEALAEGIAVPPDAIAARYAAEPARFRQPERRDLTQALLPDEASATALAEAWRAGATPEALATQARAAGGEVTELEALDRDGLPFPALAAAAFGAPESAVAGPVRSPLGWHVLRVVRVLPPATRPIEEVREELAREIALDRAADQAIRLVDRVEDLLAGGTPLAEAAARHGLRVIRARLDPSGQPVGEETPFEGLAPSLVTALGGLAAQADPGRAPRLEEIEAARFAAVQITGVTPPALRPFEEVEAAVRAAFAIEARRRAQEERAAALMAAVRGGAAMGNAAAGAGLAADRLPPVSRRQAPGEPTLEDQLRTAAFNAARGEVVMIETGTGFVVAQVVDVTPGDPGADPVGLGNLRNEVERQMQDDLEQQFLAALRARAGVTVNQAALRRIANP